MVAGLWGDAVSECEEVGAIDEEVMDIVNFDNDFRVAAIRETSEAHERLLKEILQSWRLSKNDFNEFSVCAPSSRGQLYHVERRLREEREQRRHFFLSDFYALTMFCKSLLPPSKCLSIQAKNKTIETMTAAITDIPTRIRKGKEQYSDRTVGILGKHEAQIKKQKNCVSVIRKLLAKEHDYVNILCVAEASVRAMKRRGKQYLDTTTPDIARDFRRIFERYVSLYMQQRQHGINPTEATLNEADALNRTRFVAGKSSKLEVIRAAMENVAARIVPPGIQIKELSNAILLRVERIAKIDQLSKPMKDSFSNFAQVVKSRSDISVNAKQLLTLMATCLVSIIKELMPKLQEITEKRGNIQTKLNGLAEHVKIKRQECRPHIRLIKHFNNKLPTLHKELASLSRLEAGLRMKLIKLVQHLAESEEQFRLASTDHAEEVDDSRPLTQEELALHQEAIEKVKLRMSYIETEAQAKDLEDLINRKRCHLKLQLAHLQKQAEYTQDEQEGRTNTLEMYKKDNIRLKKYVSDNEAFLRKVDEAIARCNRGKEMPESNQKQYETLEKDCYEIQAEIEKLIKAPDNLYPQIRQLEHEIDSIKNRCREKRRNLHKMQATTSREKEMRQGLAYSRQSRGQFPGLIEKDLKTVDEEVKALQIRFDQVFNNNIEVKGALIEQESTIDRYRRSIARLETDIAMTDMEIDEITCKSKSKERSQMLNEKQKLRMSIRNRHHLTSSQNVPVKEQSFQASPEKQRDLYQEQPASVCQEEVNIRRTFTIHPSRGLPTSYSRDKTPGYGIHAGRTVRSPPEDKQKDNHLKELLTSTKIPDKRLSQDHEDIRDSPEHAWVSYTDGKDIPTVLRTDIGLQSMKPLRQSVQKSYLDAQQRQRAGETSSLEKVKHTASQNAEKQEQQKTSKAENHIPDDRTKRPDPKGDRSMKTPTNTETMQ
ncbi:hypothetical protein TTRE_0000659801 [Trichuris trichiura]|uniref:Uncharacterized protein n=1 Tax=Trichuris trichiura TaxID=36087 RepID=A0A077ZD05_TRITR|nr:hypothetical protein TTRE_0000659801 [Trichuris trichiura]